MLVDVFARLFGTDFPVFALLFVGLAVEKYYVSRATVFTNTIALNVSFLSLESAPKLLVWYGGVGSLLGMYGMVTYLLNTKTGRIYNLPAFTFYASLPVATVILVDPGGWWVALFVGGLVNFAGGVRLEGELGVDVTHWGRVLGQ